MQDILIRRCTLRVVRRGGWSWGADPRRLLRNSLDAVPALVAARLADLLKDVPGDGEIAEPIRIRVPVRMDAIRAASRLDAAGAAGHSPRWMARIDEALTHAVEGIRIAPPQNRREQPAVDPAPPPKERSVDVLREALLAWWRSGMLPPLLAAADEQTISRWLLALGVASGAETATASSGGSVESAPAGANSITTRRRLNMSARDQLAAIVRHLASTAETAASPADPHEPARLPPAESRRPGSGVMPADAPGPSAAVPRSPDAAASVSDPAPVRSPSAPPLASRDPLVDAEILVTSALPWLLLVPLHRVGYLRMLRVALEAAGLERHAALFGAALAYKLAGPAGRAWQKSADADRVAMVMAAQRAPVAKPDLHRFGHRLAPHCPLLDTQIAHAIAEGKPKDDPWLVHLVRSDPAPAFALIDPEGLFPAWWAVDAAATADALRSGADAEAIVTEGAADPRLLEMLTVGGVRFVTTSRPGRGESWSRVVAGGPGAWWSNASGAVTPAARRRMTHADDLAARAGALVEEFSGRRLALPLDPTSAIERSLSLAVSLALGTIAWELWHARESTDPLLALSRFADLDARVIFTRHSVRVVVPLGRRHRDLYDAGLLADVREVPWLDGRTLEFSGG